MKENLSLLLEHEPIPSLPSGYHSTPKEPGVLQLVPIADLNQAQIRYCQFIGENGLCGSNLTERSGLIIDADGVAEMRVEFSGNLRMIEKRFIKLEAQAC